MFLRFLLTFLLILIVEVYFLQAVKTFARDFSMTTRQVVLTVAYLLMALSLAVGLVSVFFPPPQWPAFFRFFSGAMLVLVLCKLVGSSFLIIDDLIRLFRWIYSLFKSAPAEAQEVTNGISRLKFLSQLAVTFTVIPAVGLIYGIVRGAYKYKVHKVKVPSSKIPAAFDGFKIVQLSDIHTGSFSDTVAINKAFDLVMAEKPDLIVFTGDLVNNHSDETNGFVESFRRLQAPYGVYSVLGNHDYGDYIEWESADLKRANLERLKSIQASAGWRLLMNEHVALEKDGEKIALLGIENWGGNMRFPKYGKMTEAHKDTAAYPFRILLSHDPSHWEQEVQPKYPDIDLTLSGHTHGMQMGIEIPGLKWSPSQYFYKQWAGLYKSGEQFLYVNRGLGFLGYPGRLGIWPEITVMELQSLRG
jgi:predicted MPP superfamily phosphohydrolase